MTDTHAPMAGYRVYEAAFTPAAAHAGRLFRQLGAEVWRADGIAQLLIPDVAREMYAAGKQPASSGMPERFDIVVLDGRRWAGVDQRAVTGLDLPEAAVVVEILGADETADPGGRTGGTPLGASAVAGAAVAMGRPDRAPLGLPPGVVESVAGTQGVAAALAQLWHGVPDGETVRIELTLNGCLEFLVGMNSKVFEGYPRTWRREGRRTAGSGGPYPAAIFPSRDGFIGIIGRTVENWQGILRAMGDPAWADESGMRDPFYVAEHRADETDVLVDAWTRQHTSAELIALSLEHGFIVAPVKDLDDVLSEKQYRLRSFWEELPGGGLAPGLPFTCRQVDIAATGGGGGELLPVAGGELLAGLRVLDLSWVWAGPMVTMVLADLGAEVVKVEHPSRPDPSRLRGRPSRDGVPVDGPPLEVSPYFHQLNHGKLSVGADLRSGDARALIKRMAASCDVIVENMRPGVLTRRGLGYDDLAAAEPGLVMLSMTLAGQDGPLSEMRGYAPVMSGLAGLERHMGYPEDDLTGMYTFSFADANAAVYGVVGILAQLIRRRVDGRGCYLDLSQVETTLASMSLQLAEAQQGRTSYLRPNVDRRYAFQEVVHCAGADEWLAVTAASTADLDRLRAVLGGEELSAWARRRPVAEAENIFRDVGVAAFAVCSWDDVVARREAHGPRQSVVLDHPYGAYPDTYVAPWFYDGELNASRRRAPLLGEHTARMAQALAGAGPEEITELTASGAVTAIS